MFKIHRVPKYITSLICDLQIFFNDHQWLHFQMLLISLLVTPYKKTITGMVKVLGIGTHRSKHNFFLLHSHEIILKVLSYYALLILSLIKKHNEPLYFIIDDTTNKKTGKKVEGAYKFFDHLSKTYIWGQQIVCSIISYRGIIIPYRFSIYIPEEQCETLGIKFKKKTQLALEQIKNFEPDSGQEVFILADTYYATEPIINYCRLKKHYFISSLKFNRVFRVNGHQTNVSKYLRYTIKSFKKSQRIRLGKTLYKVISRKVELKTGGAVKLVFTKHPTHRTAMVLISTGTALPAYKIMEAYNQRWKIEIFFKMSKQYLGLNGYQSTNIEAIKSRIGLTMISYTILTHAFIRDMRAKGKSLTKKNISGYSVTEVLADVRYRISVDNIEHCIDDLSTVSRNKIKSEFKSKLIKAA